MNIITLYYIAYVNISSEDRRLFVMQVWDVPDVTGRLFPPFPAPGPLAGTGGEGTRVSGRERALKHGGGFSQLPALCW